MKYKLTEEKKTFAHPLDSRQVTVYRIEALKDFMLW